jgi:hypothetical protein
VPAPLRAGAHALYARRVLPAGVTSDVRPAAAALAVGCTPFAAGAALGPDVLDGPALCPFRAATGVPCPLCGGVRAFALAGRGDAGFLEYNGFWVLAAAALVLLAAASLAWTALGRARPSPAASAAAAAWRTPRRAALTLAVLAALGWAWALLQRDAILG